MPSIVLIVDELTDLMKEHNDKVEKYQSLIYLQKMV